jgi:hypothetical protein
MVLKMVLLNVAVLLLFRSVEDAIHSFSSIGSEIQRTTKYLLPHVMTYNILVKACTFIKFARSDHTLETNYQHCTSCSCCCRLMNIIYSRAGTGQVWSVPKSILSQCGDFDEDEEKDIMVN